MKFNYEYTKKDLINYLIKSKLISNLILFVFLITIYIIFFKTFYLFWTIVVILGSIILINLVYIFLYILINKKIGRDVYGKYTLELAQNKFSIKIGKTKKDYKYTDIRKIIERKNFFVIKLRRSINFLIFERRLFNKKDYGKLVKEFKEKAK